MSEQPPRKIASEFAGVLARAGIGMAPVESSRRLLLHIGSAGQYIEEFFSPQLDRRMIVSDANGSLVETYRNLAQHNIPLLAKSEVTVDGLHLWDVPPGSRSLTSVVHLIAQNVERYGALLFQAKEIQTTLAETGLGILASEGDRTILDHFVVTQTEDGMGASLAIAPPYAIHAGDTSEGLVGIRDELYATGYFAPDQLTPIFEYV